MPVPTLRPLIGLTLATLTACAGTRPVPPAVETACPPAPAAPACEPCRCPSAPQVATPPSPVEPAARTRELARVTFAAVGDVLPHGAVKKSAERWNQVDAHGRSVNNEGWDALLAGVAPELSRADLAFANLETPVSPDGDSGSREFNFNAPPVMVQALKKAGVDLVGFANNHVYDQGHRGVVQTLDELEKAELPQAGAGRTLAEAFRGLRLERNGVRIAVLGASQFFNKSEHAPTDPAKPAVARIDDGAALEAAVRAARADSEFVIVSLHWGVEYQPQPRESEIALAHRLFEAGADVILGTHPHILQPLEVYRAADGRDCLVIYSLGNFISNQSRFYAHGVSPEKVGDTRDSAILRFAIVKRDYGAGQTRAELADVSYVPIWTENDHLTRKPKELPDIRVVGIAGASAALRAEVERIAAEAAAQKAVAQRLVELEKRLELFSRRRAIIESRLGPDFAAEPLR